MRVHERQRHLRIVSAGGIEVCARCLHARTPLRRLRGLLGRPALRPGSGLLIEPCASVHTLFLPGPIEVVFLDRAGAVAGIVPVLRPWRFAARRGARSVLELPPGTCALLGLTVGDRLLQGSASWVQPPDGPARRHGTPSTFVAGDVPDVVNQIQDSAA